MDKGHPPLHVKKAAFSSVKSELGSFISISLLNSSLSDTFPFDSSDSYSDIGYILSGTILPAPSC